MDQPSERANADLREPPRDGGPREAAFYIKGAIAELSGMARIHRLEVLGYLLIWRIWKPRRRCVAATGA